MRRFVRAAIVLIAAVGALAFGSACAVFVWASTALRPDLSPPDPSSVPPTVLSLLRLDVGSGASLQASRFLVDETPMRDPRYAPAQLLARTWVEYRWTHDEALAEIALRSHFGHGFVGVHEAARGYFGIPAEALSVAQVAALVAITWAPSGRSPWCHPDRLLAAIPHGATAPLDGLLAPAADACESS
jgi:hypothetical protein